MKAVRILSALLLASGARAQSSSATIAGVFRDADSGAPIAGAIAVLRNLGTGEVLRAVAGATGDFVLLSAPPGEYSARFAADKYQSRDIARLQIPVALRISLSVALRNRTALIASPANGYRAAPSGAAVTPAPGLPIPPGLLQGFGFDYRITPPAPFQQTLAGMEVPQPSLSYVIDASWLSALPISGRDVYTTIVALPGVNSDGATARGLGMAVNGQRPSASNFLLDGVENNSALLSGPLSVMAPESVAEYRVSTASYSAEFGRTTGAIANAVTPSGTNTIHGSLYGYGNSDRLNANSFEHNAGFDSSHPGVIRPLPRPIRHEVYAGGSATGALRRDTAFWSAAVEHVGVNARQDPLQFRTFCVTCYTGIVANDVVKLMRSFPALGSVNEAASRQANDATENREYSPDFRSRRTSGLLRFDQNLPSRDRILERAIFFRATQPNFIPSTFANLDTPFRDGSAAAAIAWFRIRSSWANEARFSWQVETLGWNGPHPTLPVSTVEDPVELTLPGGPGSAFSYRSRVAELSDTFRWTRGRHSVAAGAGALFRFSVAHPSANPTGTYDFLDVRSFAVGGPAQYESASYRPWIPDSGVPDTRVPLANAQTFQFVQDEVRISSRLGLTVGLRLESFGIETASATWNSWLSGASGSSPEAALRNATGFVASKDKRPLFASTGIHIGPRIGGGYRISETTVARASFGVFYDRPYDNLFETTSNNAFLFQQRSAAAFLPFVGAEARPAGSLVRALEPRPVWIDDQLKVARVTAWTAGLEQSIGSSLSIALQHSAALASNLLTGDVVNRSEAASDARLNNGLRELFRLSNQSPSSYYAFTARALYRTRRQQWQFAYTWSHSIDNQSDPLQGVYQDLQFIRTPGAGSATLAAFERQFDAAGDRGSSDFDQRHNAVLIYTVQLPDRSPGAAGAKLTNGWRVSAFAAVRSGFPFTVPADPGLARCAGGGTPSPYSLLQQRAGLVSGVPLAASGRAFVGGWQVLNPAAFCSPALDVPGSLGRNSLAGPGFWNADVSVSRTIQISERFSVRARADFFNVFNHANLANPRFERPEEFGVARYDRLGAPGQFPAVAPLAQGPRTIFFGIRFLF